MSLSPHNRVLVGALALALTMLVPALPVFAKPGNSLNAKSCKGGWASLATANGTRFANQDECVAYGAHGGTYGVPERVFAVAFTDVNSNHSYEPATDTLIAKLADTNLDGALSIGDTITTNRYPLTTSATTFGSFGTVTHPVTLVNAASATAITVFAGSAVVFQWARSDTFELYEERDLSIWSYGHGETLVHDSLSLNVNVCDQILVQTDSPSVPDTAVDHRLCRDDTNNDFVDVNIDLSGM